MLVFIFSALSQTSWVMNINIETADTTVFKRSYGIAEGATDGYDILNDIPLFISEDDTSTYFPISATFINALSTDIRNSRVSSHIWSLCFQNMPYSIVNWSSDSIPESGSFEISFHHSDSTPSTWINMRDVSAVAVPSDYQIALKWLIPLGEDTISPYVTAWNPSNGSSGIPRETNVYCEVKDAGTGVDEGTIEILVNGLGVTWLSTIDTIDGGFSILYDPPIDFGWNSVVSVVVSAYDSETPANFVSDTVFWRTITDSMSRTIDGIVGTGDPISPIENAIVEISDFVDTTDITGYYSISNISDGYYTLSASADGYATKTIFINISNDTTVQIILDILPSPEVLLIDYDSGVKPFISGIDSIGEDDIIADLLESTGYSFIRTSENPSLSEYRLDDFRFVILVTPVRDSDSHGIIPESDLNILSNWLEADGRILWIAPDAGIDYYEGGTSARNFYNLFGSIYSSDGRPSNPIGNVINLSGEARWFYLTVNAEYAINSLADNYIDEFNPIDESTYVALSSQSTLPEPISATGRVMFRDLPRYRSILSSILFGGIEDGFFPNNKTSIFRGCMNFLSNEFSVNEVPIIPESYIIQAFPNPFNSKIRIKGFEIGKKLVIIDLSGRIIEKIEVCQETISWTPGENILSGVYLICEVDSNRSTKIVYMK